MKTSDNQGHQILVVDDEPSVCKAIKLLLEFDGHSVKTVESGEAALAMFEPGMFDLVITDYSMWGMKGDALAAFIKARHPDQAIIMATAFAGDFPTAGKSSAGVDFVISKPFSLTELRDAITKVIPESPA